jgi:hypothetical protein
MSVDVSDDTIVIDNSTLVVVFGSALVGSLLGPFVVLLIIVGLIFYKNRELILQQTPRTEEFLRRMKERLVVLFRRLRGSRGVF